MRYGRYSQETKDLLNSIGEKGLEKTINNIKTVAFDIESYNTIDVFFEGGLRLIISSEVTGHDEYDADTEMNYTFFNENNETLVYGVTTNTQSSIRYDEKQFRDEDERREKAKIEEANRKTQKQCIENVQRKIFLQNFNK